MTFGGQNNIRIGEFQMQAPPSTTAELHFALNFPLIFFIVLVVVYLLYRFLSKRQLELSMDDGWLEDDSESNQ